MAEEPMDTPQVINVKVVNRNTFTVMDRFDGVPYVFPENKAVSVPIEAANHIFGWYPGVNREEMRRHVQRRMGWNTPEMVKSNQHDKFFDAIDIAPITYRMIPIEVDENGDEVKPVKTAARMTAKPELEGPKKLERFEGGGAA